jgi:hypothetical protein
MDEASAEIISATSELYDDSSAANFFAQPKFLPVDFRKVAHSEIFAAESPTLDSGYWYLVTVTMTGKF